MGRKRDKGKQRKAKQSPSSIYTRIDGCNHGASNSIPKGAEKIVATYSHAFNKDVTSKSVGYAAFIHAKCKEHDVWSNESHREVLRKVFIACGVSNLLQGLRQGEFTTAGNAYFRFASQQHAVGISIIEGRSIRSVRDLVQGGTRSLVSFYHKRAECECLKGLWDQVESLPKIASCDGLCQKYIDRSVLMLCGCCRTEQYCSVACQEHAWEELGARDQVFVNALTTK